MKHRRQRSILTHISRGRRVLVRRGPSTSFVVGCSNHTMETSESINARTITTHQRNHAFKRGYRVCWFWVCQVACCRMFAGSCLSPFTVIFNSVMKCLTLLSARETPYPLSGDWATNALHNQAHFSWHLLAIMFMIVANGDKLGVEQDIQDNLLFLFLRS